MTTRTRYAFTFTSPSSAHTVGPFLRKADAFDCAYRYVDEIHGSMVRIADADRDGLGRMKGQLMAEGQRDRGHFADVSEGRYRVRLHIYRGHGDAACAKRMVR